MPELGFHPAYVLAEAGDLDVARAAYTAWARDIRPLAPQLLQQWTLAYEAVYALRTGDAAIAARLTVDLEPFRNHFLGGDTTLLGAAEGAMARAAIVEGRFADAVELAEHALAAAAQRGWHTLATQHRVDLSCALLGRAGPGDTDRAAALLAEAIETADALGLAPAAREARSLLGVDEAASEAGAVLEGLAVEDPVVVAALELEPLEAHEQRDRLVDPFARRPHHRGQLLLGDGEREAVGVGRQLEEPLRRARGTSRNTSSASASSVARSRCTSRRTITHSSSGRVCRTARTGSCEISTTVVSTSARASAMRGASSKSESSPNRPPCSSTAMTVSRPSPACDAIAMRPSATT